MAMMAMTKFFDKLVKPKAEDVAEYVELDLGEYEGTLESAPAELYVRVAEITNISEIPELKKEIYDGNIVIVDISLVRQDKLALDRVVKELKHVVADVRGDIAGIGEDQLVVTPNGIKIDRTKVVGGGY